MKKTILMVAFFMNALLFGQSTTNLKVTESPEFKDNYSGATVLALWTTPTGNTGLVRYGKKEFLFDVFDKINHPKSFIIVGGGKKQWIIREINKRKMYLNR